MDIEQIYRDALNAGNHSSALKAVFKAGGGSLTEPVVPPEISEVKPMPASIVEAIAAIDKAEKGIKSFWHPV